MYVLVICPRKKNEVNSQIIVIKLFICDIRKLEINLSEIVNNCRNSGYLSFFEFMRYKELRELVHFR